MQSPLAAKIATIAEKRRCSGEGRKRMGSGILESGGEIVKVVASRGGRLTNPRGQDRPAMSASIWAPSGSSVALRYHGRLDGSPEVDPLLVSSAAMPQSTSASAA